MDVFFSRLSSETLTNKQKKVLKILVLVHVKDSNPHKSNQVPGNLAKYGRLHGRCIHINT